MNRCSNNSVFYSLLQLPSSSLYLAKPSTCTDTVTGLGSSQEELADKVYDKNRRIRDSDE